HRDAEVGAGALHPLHEAQVEVGQGGEPLLGQSQLLAAQGHVGPDPLEELLEQLRAPLAVVVAPRDAGRIAPPRRAKCGRMLRPPAWTPSSTSSAGSSTSSVSR